MSTSSSKPSCEVQKELFTALEKEMKEGDHCYLVNLDWWKQWNEYTGSKGTSSYSLSQAPPPSIDNSVLLDSNGNLQRSISDGNDFHLVNEIQWKLLLGWYGGGPVIQRTTVRKNPSRYDQRPSVRVEVHLLRLRLVYQSLVEHIECSETMTCRELMNLGLSAFNLKEENTKMYDYFLDKRYKELFEMGTTLSDQDIHDDQKILFDEIEAPSPSLLSLETLQTENTALKEENLSLKSKNESTNSSLKQLEGLPFVSFWLSLSDEEAKKMKEEVGGSIRKSLGEQIEAHRFRLVRVKERVEVMKRWLEEEEDVDIENIEKAKEHALELQGDLECKLDRWVEVLDGLPSGQ